MLLHVTHTTIYCYARPVRLLAHQMLLRPRASDSQRLVTSSLTCSPDAEVAWAQDVFGNVAATATFSRDTQDLTIVSTAQVEQTAAEWPVVVIAPSAHVYPFAYAADDLIDLGALAVPEHDDRAGIIRHWARAFVLGSSTDTLSLLKDLNAGVLNAVAYRIRDEEGTQTPQETLDKASGSCRDIAALFIEAARHLGFGARAVTGYLHDPSAPSGDPGSTHAWAEIFLPEAGWIAFDPTHRRMGGAGLIPVAVGRSNSRIMPVAGRYIGKPEDFVSLQVEVTVRAD